jgi:ABC-2 type transport system permease protein
MKDFRTLKVLDHFEGLFQRFNIDYQMMRKILRIKLMMDQRRVPTIFNQSAKKKGKEHKNESGYIKSLWIYVLFGLMTIPFIIMGDHYFFQMSLVFGILMFLVMTSMISDFSSVLLDIRDRNILHPKPIDRKTLSTAKMIHVSIYLFFLTTSIIGIPLIVGLFKNGILFFFLSVITVLLINVFVLVFTAMLYMFILKFFDGEKLKDLINYVQIGLSLAMMIGYQLLVRSFEFVNLTIVVEPKWWQIFIFPMWYGAMFELVMKGQFSFFYTLLSICGIVIPIIAFAIYLRLVPTFEKNLQKLSVHGSGKVTKRSKMKEWWLNRICSTKEEKAFFRFASLMMKNERDFKLKVYPSLGFSLVVPFLLLINQFSSHSFEDVSGGKSYLNIYFSLLIIPSVVLMLKFSGKYKGAWIYKAAPIKELLPVFSGTMKAFIVKLYLPLFLLLSAIFVGIFGARILPDLMIVFLNASTFAMLCFVLLKKTLPFSESFEGMQQNDGWKTFLLFLFLPVFAGLHFTSTLIPYGVYGYLILMVVVLMIFWKIVFRVSWEKVQS